jgi:4,4'-diaponeurosporenoate glycosyltransferase
MVSVQPTHRVERVYERASAVANVVALMAGTGQARAKRSWWRGPVGFGPAMAVPRDVYLASGGHRLVGGEVAEDVALARALADRGIAVSAFADAGAGEVEYRMYPDGLRSLVQGWTKNLAAGASKIPRLRALLVAVWITAAIAAVAAISSRPLGYAVFVGQFAILFRRAGRFGVITAAAYPLPLFAFVALFARSAFGRATRRPAAWRGRWVTP